MKARRIFAMFIAVILFVSSFSACAKSGTKPTTTAETTASPVSIDTNNWPKYDALIAQIRTSADFSAREALMHHAEDILMNTGAVCPIYYCNDIYMMKSSISGFYETITGYKFFMYTLLPGATKLRINLAGEPATLDPALNSSVDGSILAANSFAGLYTYGPDGKAIPALAKSYTVSADRMTYVFTMKDNLKWSDGSALTAKDLEYSWKRAAGTQTAADYAYMFNGIKGYGTAENIDVKASDDGKTLTVVLVAPSAYFLNLCAFPTFFAVKQSQVENAKGYKDATGKILNPGAWAAEAGFVSSGAFTLQSWNHNTSMVYVKNPYYWDAANVKMDKLEFTLSTDDTAIYTAYKAGKLDFIDTVPADEIKDLLSNPEFHIIDQLGTYYIAFNVKSNLFRGKTTEQADAMRRGLGLLINRKYIIDTVGRTGQKIANTFIPEGMNNGYSDMFKLNDISYIYPVKDDIGYFSLGATAAAYAANVQAGIALLKTAGFEFDVNGILSVNTPLSFDYLINENTGNQQIAECLKRDFAAVGIVMTIKAVNEDTFLAERNAGRFDAACGCRSADLNDPFNMLEMWGTSGSGSYCRLGK